MEQMEMNAVATGGSILLDPLWFEESTSLVCFYNPSRQAVEIKEWFEYPLEPIDVAMSGSGSGFAITALRGDCSTATGKFLSFESPVAAQSVARSASEMITFIRASLGISMNDLARSLNNTRQTIYDWLDGQVPRSDSLRRIDHLYRLAEYWNSLCAWPIGKHVHQVINNDKSLFDLFAATIVDDQRVRSAMCRMAEVIVKANGVKKANSIADRLSGLGFKPISERDFASNLNAVSPSGDIPEPDVDADDG